MRKHLPLLLLLALLALLTVSLALAAVEAYSLPWWTVDAGGGSSASPDGRFSLSGSLGQPDAGAPMTGGPYTLQGGFWQASPASQAYLPVMVR